MIATVLPLTSRPQYLQRCAGAWWAIDLSLRTVRRRAISPDAPVWVGRLTAAPWLRRCVFAIWFRSTFLWVLVLSVYRSKRTRRPWLAVGYVWVTNERGGRRCRRLSSRHP